MSGETPERPSLRAVYDIANRLEDKVDKRLEAVTDSVEKLRETMDRIDRQGSIGTKSELEDHEQRIRDNAERLLVLESSRVTRQDIHGLKNDIAAIALGLADRPQQVKEFGELKSTVGELVAWRNRTEGEDGANRRFSDRALALTSLGITLLGALSALAYVIFIAFAG